MVESSLVAFNNAISTAMLEIVSPLDKWPPNLSIVGRRCFPWWFPRIQIWECALFRMLVAPAQSLQKSSGCFLSSLTYSTCIVHRSMYFALSLHLAQALHIQKSPSGFLGLISTIAYSMVVCFILSSFCCVCIFIYFLINIRNSGCCVLHSSLIQFIYNIL